MLTQGERYRYSDGEQEVIAKANELLKEAFDKIAEAEQVLKDAGGGWAISFYCDKDDDGNYKLPTNFQTEIRIDVRVDDAWMSSYQDC